MSRIGKVLHAQQDPNGAGAAAAGGLSEGAPGGRGAEAENAGSCAEPDGGAPCDASPEPRLGSVRPESAAIFRILASF